MSITEQDFDFLTGLTDLMDADLAPDWQRQTGLIDLAEFVRMPASIEASSWEGLAA